MNESQQGLEFDLVEGKYYRLRGDLYLSEDDEKALNLPPSEQVATHYKSNPPNKQMLPVTDEFIDFFTNRLHTFQRKVQPVLDKMLGKENASSTNSHNTPADQRPGSDSTNSSPQDASSSLDLDPTDTTTEIDGKKYQ